VRGLGEIEKLTFSLDFFGKGIESGGDFGVERAKFATEDFSSPKRFYVVRVK